MHCASTYFTNIMRLSKARFSSFLRPGALESVFFTIAVTAYRQKISEKVSVYSVTYLFSERCTAINYDSDSSWYATVNLIMHNVFLWWDFGYEKNTVLFKKDEHAVNRQETEAAS